MPGRFLPFPSWLTVYAPAVCKADAEAGFLARVRLRLGKEVIIAAEGMGEMDASGEEAPSHIVAR